MFDIYDAIDDDTAMARLSESVAAACGGRSAAIQCFTPGGEQHFAQMSYFPADAFQHYLSEHRDEDPWTREYQGRGTTGRAVSMDEIVPPEMFVRTGFYNEVFRAIGDDTARCMGALARTVSALTVMAVHRPLRGAPFSAAEVGRCQEVFGHVQRVLRLRRLFEAERTHARRLEAMIAVSGAAILLVDRQLKIMSASPAALVCLNSGDGFACRNGALSMADLAAIAQVRASVAATIDRHPVLRSGFTCRRPSGHTAYRLLVLPAGAKGSDGALVVIDDPARIDGSATRKKWIAEAYGLTPVESTLADELLCGMSLQQIASKRRVTLETIRTQVKSLFVKTETHRQIDLVALLSRIPQSTD